MYFENLDEKDNAIIKMLVDDARLNYSEIGEKIGLSRVAVKNRVKALEEKGIIKGYHAAIDPVAAPQNLTFVAVIKTTPQSYGKITEILKNEPCVKTLCKMSGESQLHAICVANDFDQMQKFADRLNNCDIGLISFSAKMVWEIVKGSVLPN